MTVHGHAPKNVLCSKSLLRSGRSRESQWRRLSSAHSSKGRRRREIVFEQYPRLSLLRPFSLVWHCNGCWLSGLRSGWQRDVAPAFEVIFEGIFWLFLAALQSRPILFRKFLLRVPKKAYYNNLSDVVSHYDGVPYCHENNLCLHPRPVWRQAQEWPRHSTSRAAQAPPLQEWPRPGATEL